MNIKSILIEINDLRKELLESYEWKYLEHRKELYGETDDYWHRVSEYNDWKNGIERRIRYLEEWITIIQRVQDRQKAQETKAHDSFAYDDWNNNQSWSDFSKTIRG